MGDQKELRFWLLENFGSLEFRLERLSWIKWFLPEFTDVSIHCNYNDVRLVGWGAGPTEDLALTKAAAELFERIVLHEHRFRTSNGLAAHSVIEEAHRNAISEIRERDLFLCHFLTGIPLEKPDSDLIKEFGLNSANNWFRDRGVNFSLFRLGRDGIVAALDGRGAKYPFGLIFGSAVRGALRDAALSASIEAWRDGVRILSLGPKVIGEAIGLSEFLSKTDPTFSDHARLALNLKYASSIDWLIGGSAEKEPSHCGIATPTVDEVILRDPDYAGVPLKFSRARSETLQDLYVGPTKQEYVNLARLRRFAGVNISFEDLTEVPHPFA